MGTSTDGLLFYGWCFDEGHEFPWSDIEECCEASEVVWWRKVNGYEPPFKLYDEHGEYLNGRAPTDQQCRDYCDHHDRWDEAYPLPFEAVNYCYCDSPMWAFAVHGTLVRAYRGDPKVIDPHQMLGDVVREAGVKKVREFCATHGIELPGEPRWYLASYWG